MTKPNRYNDQTIDCFCEDGGETFFVLNLVNNFLQPKSIRALRQRKPRSNTDKNHVEESPYCLRLIERRFLRHRDTSKVNDTFFL